VLSDDAEQLATGYIPQPHYTVIAPVSQRLACRVKRNGSDGMLMPFEGPEQLAADYIPQLHCIIIAPAGQHTAYRIKRDAQNNAFVPCEGAYQLHPR
jgi:hypothetical protein